MARPQIKRVIPLEEVRAVPAYSRLAELAVIFNHDIIEDEGGAWRWKPNGLIRHLYSGEAVFHIGSPESYGTPGREAQGCVDLNALWAYYGQDYFTSEEMVKHYMSKGYSLSGFLEVFCQHEEVDGSEQPILDAVLERNRGKVLKI